MSCFLYILKSRIVDKYTGMTLNAEERLDFHNIIEKDLLQDIDLGRLYFKQEFESRQAALIAERKIKKWKSKQMIEEVINRVIKL